MTWTLRGTGALQYRGTQPLPLALSPQSSVLSLISNRDFQLLWLGQAVSQVGDRVQQIALVWWALDRGGTLAAVSWALVASTVPAVLIGLFAGAVADRADRRALMIACDLLRAVVAAGTAYLAWAGQLTYLLLLIATALISTVGAFFGPAALAAVPDIVREDELVRANALQEVTAQGAMVFGPALGGALVAWMGTAAAFAVNALSFLMCGAALIAIRLQHRWPAAGAESGWQQITGGLTVLQENPTIATLLGLFAIANFFLVPVTVFLPYYARDVFRAGAGGLGILEGTIGIGMLAGALALAGRGAVRRRRAAIQMGLILPGASLVFMGLWPSFPGFLGALFVLGAALSVLNVVAVTHFQQVVPADKLGRFMGLLMTVIMALMPISYAAAGLLAASMTAGTILACGGGVLVVLGAGMPVMKSLRSLAAVDS